MCVQYGIHNIYTYDRGEIWLLLKRLQVVKIGYVAKLSQITGKILNIKE